MSAARGNLVAAFVVAASALCGSAVGASGRRDEDVQWVRMCTFTSRGGGSAINATVPCGVRVFDESSGGGGTTVDGSTPGDGVENGRLRDGGQNATTVGDRGAGVDGTPHSDGTFGLGTTTTTTTTTAGVTDGEGVDGEGEEYDDDDDDDYGVTVVEAQDDGVTAVGAQDDDEAGENRPSGGGDDATVGETVKSDVRRDGGGVVPTEVSGLGVTANAAADDHDHDHDDGDSVTVVRDGSDGHQGHQRHGAVAEALLRYLREARNRLHDKIHNLLNFLQHTFFNAKLNHRSRRNLAERQTITGGRRQGNKKKQSIASVIMEPTFERSLMTMSFLMFGVFVIQVVQRLMQTLHQSGEMTSMGNSIFENLPTVS